MFSLTAAGLLVKRACLFSELLCQAGSCDSDAGGRGGDGFRG